ncbi:hypothetical protein NDU88_004895 [Pleurodeles waltl]|uniref:Uncharacterized protein n=1 Tax=Pleurodeles waltl TaxID=8319 RepID=A0AAV7UIC9_PLEWA|nr:hypothetical protein NDU88_004895 [Pleurodeles waltl]
MKNCRSALRRTVDYTGRERLEAGPCGTGRRHRRPPATCSRFSALFAPGAAHTARARALARADWLLRSASKLSHAIGQFLVRYVGDGTMSHALGFNGSVKCIFGEGAVACLQIGGGGNAKLVEGFCEVYLFKSESENPLKLSCSIYFQHSTSAIVHVVGEGHSEIGPSRTWGRAAMYCVRASAWHEPNIRLCG